MRYPTVSNNDGDHRSHFGDGNECYVHERSRWRPLLALGGGFGRLLHAYELIWGS